MATQGQMKAKLDGDRRQMVLDAVTRAVSEYHDDQVPDDAIDRMQDALCVRAITLESADVGLAIIEQLGVTFACEDATEAVEALGMVLAHGAVLAAFEEMAVEPIVELAQAFRSRLEIQPLRASAAIASAVGGKPWFAITPTTLVLVSADERRLAVADALALAIAKALDDVEIGHDVVVKPLELLLVIGREILEGRSTGARGGVSTAPYVPSSPMIHITGADGSTEERRLSETLIREVPPRHAMTQNLRSHAMDRGWEALEQLRQASANLVDAAATEPGGFVVGRRCSKSEMADIMATERARVRGKLAELTSLTEEAGGYADAIDKDAPNPAAPERCRLVRQKASGPGKGTPCGNDAVELLHGIWMCDEHSIEARRINRLGNRSVTALPTDANLVKGGVIESGAAALKGPVPGLAEDKICPLCAAPMSASHADLWTCSNGHEHTGMQLAALLSVRPDPVTRSGRSFPPPRRK